MENYRLEGQTFVIDDYDKMPAFFKLFTRSGRRKRHSNVDLLHKQRTGYEQFRY